MEIRFSEIVFGGRTETKCFKINSMADVLGIVQENFSWLNPMEIQSLHRNRTVSVGGIVIRMAII